jgi:hypothetical protein
MAPSPRRGLMLFILTIVGSAATRMAARSNRAVAAAGAWLKSSSRLRSGAPVATYQKVGGYHGKHRRLT